jgi:hypothetical protein
MKYQLITAIFAVTLSACGGGESANPFNLVDDQSVPVETPEASQPALNTPHTNTPTNAQAPVMPVTEEQVTASPPEPVVVDTPPVEEPPPVVAMPVEQLPIPQPQAEPNPETEIEGIWHCKQFGEDFTWNLRPDRTIEQHNPGVFFGVIGTYWHLEGDTFALGYTSGGIAEFTCDGETMNAGAMTCSRTPIIGD